MCLDRQASSTPLVESQTRAQLSLPPVAIRPPSGEKIAVQIPLACFLNATCEVSLSKSQTRAMLSIPAVTIRRPSGENPTATKPSFSSQKLERKTRERASQTEAI